MDSGLALRAPRNDEQGRSRGMFCPSFSKFVAPLSEESNCVEVDRQSAGLKAGAGRATAFGG